MFKWLLRKWRKRQRSVDLNILWPVCKKKAPDLDHAKAVFMLHAAMDNAWVKDFTEDELVHFIGELR